MGFFDWLRRPGKKSPSQSSTGPHPQQAQSLGGDAAKNREKWVAEVAQQKWEGKKEDLLLAIMQQARREVGHVEPSDYDACAAQLMNALTQMRSGGSRDAVLTPLMQLLNVNARTLYGEHKGLADVARQLVRENDADFKEWGVDLLGRVGNSSDTVAIVALANNHVSPKVRLEATAALGKMVRDRTDLRRDDVKKAIVFSRAEDDQKVLNTRLKVHELLKQV